MDLLIWRRTQTLECAHRQAQVMGRDALYPSQH